MKDTFEFTLNHPLTDEQWDMITDVNLERTNSVQFQTKSGNVVEFVKVIRCKDCKHRDPEDKKCDCGHSIRWQLPRSDGWFCADAERRGEGWKK